MSGHVHAELMAKYAKDARETNKPWKRWELDNGDGWLEMTAPPMWHESIKYRRKRVPREFWINVYYGGNFGSTAALHETKKAATACLAEGGETILVREVIEDED